MEVFTSPEFIVAVGSLVGVVLSWLAARGSQKIDKTRQSTEHYEGMVDALNSSYKTLAEDLKRNRKLVDKQREDAERTMEEVAAQAREITKLGAEVRRHAKALESLRTKYETALDYLEQAIIQAWDHHGVRLPEPPGEIRQDLDKRRGRAGG